MALRCSPTPLPHSVSSDMQNMRQLSREQVSRLCLVIFSFLKEQKEVDQFTSQLEDFAKDNGISLSPLKSIVRSVLLVLNGALRRNLKSEDLQSDLVALGLDEEKGRIFADKWSSDVAVLTRLAVGRTLSINQLVDMEWKFGVTAASSELEKAGTIFLQLKMVIKKGNQLEPVYVELTLPQFYSFLHEMERAKSSLDCFT
ncbi:COMM domain-containing protein 7 [Bufo gargarizans]|uniref:COMM domain-containing protein 7 n=1 Tax=Bufo gargarizans TaxID=30331 RepID=UPI001CF27AAE|nr:COMM domain-containing protein 7 [Bufo gargarizans]